MVQERGVARRLEGLGIRVEGVEPGIMLRDASPPSILELMASAAVWTPLVIAATAFLKKIAENAADEAWTNRRQIASWLTAQAVRPFQKLCELFGEMRDASGDNSHVCVGIPLPDQYFGATLKLDDIGAEEMAVKLAIFIAHTEEIEVAVYSLLEGEDAPLGPVSILVAGDGTLSLAWMGGDTLVHKTRAVTEGFAEHAGAQDGESAGAPSPPVT